MERKLTNKLEAALLYSGFETYEPNIWLKLVNEFAAGYGYSFERARHERLPSYLNMSGNGVTLEISFLDEPIEDYVFRNPLSSQITRQEFPECFYAVAKHNQYVHFAVTKGEVNPFEPNQIDDGRKPPDLDSGEYDFGVALLKSVLTMQIARTFPLAAYWAQCDRLFEPRRFLKSATDAKDLSLLVHPVHYAENASATDAAQIGVKTYGASNLVGQEIMMEPSVLQVEDATDIIMHFVSITRNTGLMLPHGDVFGRSEAETIEVQRGDPSSPFVKLKVLYSEEHGIDERPEPGETEEPEIDLTDPAERALNKKIQELMEQASEAEVGLFEKDDEVEDVGQFRQELGSEWKGVRNRVDMNKLRNLATGSNGSSLDHDEPSEDVASKNKLGRVGGFFSRK